MQLYMFVAKHAYRLTNNRYSLPLVICCVIASLYLPVPPSILYLSVSIT